MPPPCGAWVSGGYLLGLTDSFGAPRGAWGLWLRRRQRARLAAEVTGYFLRISLRLRCTAPGNGVARRLAAAIKRAGQPRQAQPATTARKGIADDGNPGRDQQRRAVAAQRWRCLATALSSVPAGKQPAHRIGGHPAWGVAGGGDLRQRCDSPGLDTQAGRAANKTSEPPGNSVAAEAGDPRTGRRGVEQAGEVHVGGSRRSMPHNRGLRAVIARFSGSAVPCTTTP